MLKAFSQQKHSFRNSGNRQHLYYASLEL